MDNKVYLHKISNNVCGQYKMTSKIVPYAKTFTKLQDGDCQSVGYTVPDGTIQLKVPVLGRLKIEKFQKPVE